MNKNALNISDLEKYTFAKYSGELHSSEKFNSYSKNAILNNLPSYPINDINYEKYSNKMIINNNKDINYNQINITHYNKSPLKHKYNNINNINNINIISQNDFNHNTNYNNINKININRTNQYSFSKERKLDRKKFRTPDKNFNYNKFNYFNSNNSEKRIQFDNNKSKNKKLNNIINYNNENITYKSNKKSKKRALTPDETFYGDDIKNMSKNNYNKNLNLNPIDYNRNININNINIINNKTKEYDLKTKHDGLLFKDDSLSQYTYNDTNSNKENNSDINNIKLYNFSSSMKNKTEYDTKYDMRNIKITTEKILDYNNLSYKDNKKTDYLNYQESCFNTRLPRGAKVPIISKTNNKNLNQSVIYNNNNKTPSPIRKNSNYLGSSIINYKNKKYLKYTRSVSSEPEMKKINNKLKQKYFKLKLPKKDYSPNNSYSKNSEENYHVNSCINNKFNKIFKNINNSCGNYNSSLNNNDKSSSHSNDKNYNMTQPDFSKSLYNWNSGNPNNINKLFNKDETNSIKNLNNNKDLHYKYLKYDSQIYNYQSYIESYGSTSKDNQSIKSNKTLKTKKYNFEKFLNINNNTTKLSTNNNTYDDNSNNTNSLYNKEIKNNKIVGTSTIEEVHFNFVNILQNTKNMIEAQENTTRDKVIYNNVNSTTIILEEIDIE